MNKLQITLQEIIKKLFNQSIEVILTRPKPEFGDFATNVALQLAKQVGQNPRQVAEQIVAGLADQTNDFSAEIAGPGFINFKLNDQVLIDSLNQKYNLPYADQTVVVEYSDPNAFKVLHAGHFYTSVVGDAIAKLVEVGGGKVYRLNFGGDVGLHVGKTMWAILEELGGAENIDKLKEINPSERADWLAKCYVAGTKAYEEDDEAHQKIIEYNKAVYKIHENKNSSSTNFSRIYWITREWSYDYFKDFYAKIGSHFDKFYPESAVASRGLKEVSERVGTVFEESNGAIIFDGKKHGLHTRVFINNEGLPTYESKDVGLIFSKYDDYKFDKSIIITADEQKQYMEVVLKALEQFAPKLANSTLHITHGIVKLAGGVKMSSRKGNFLRAIDVFDYAMEANQEQNGTANKSTALGAIKYAFLKPRIGGNIIYDPKESVSLTGNSGPYLQYSHARAKSIIAKSDQQPAKLTDLDAAERKLVIKMTEWTDVINQATVELLPHLICTYLYELAQEFNRFYEQSQIIGSDREAIRLTLITKYCQILAEGLDILGIEAPENM